jgi:hypothetical protein
LKSEYGADSDTDVDSETAAGTDDSHGNEPVISNVVVREGVLPYLVEWVRTDPDGR